MTVNPTMGAMFARLDAANIYDQKRKHGFEYRGGTWLITKGGGVTCLVCAWTVWPLKATVKNLQYL